MNIKINKKILLIVALAQLTAANAQNTGAIPTPPETKPGECVALVQVPAKLTTQTKRVAIQGATEEVEIIPPKYIWKTKDILIADEYKSIEVVPATFKTIKVDEVVEPARYDYQMIPAKYKETTKTILVKPAVQIWKKAKGGVFSASGEIMRLVTQPAKYKTITVREVAVPASYQKIEIPAILKKIEKKVIDKPATTREIMVPAEYKTIRVKQVETSLQEIATTSPAKTEEITIQTLVSQAKTSWQKVPCGSDFSEENIIKIQKGLKRAGYDVDADGKFGKGSVEALQKFQEKNGLATGALTLETMKKLGVNIK